MCEGARDVEWFVVNAAPAVLDCSSPAEYRAWPVVSAYAVEQRLKFSGLYEATSQLLRRGLWPVPTPQFVRVQLVRVAEVLPPPMFRVSLPNGVVVEAAGGELSEIGRAHV